MDARGGPSDRALAGLAAQYAVALRLGSAVVDAVVGPLAATAGVSAWWLYPVVAGLCGWSVVFAWVVRRDGLTWRIAVPDAVVIAVVVAAQRHVVPAGMIADATTWMLPLASTSVFILQLALRPVYSLPAAGVITAVYVAGVRHPAGEWFLVLQAVVTAALMTLVRNGGRSADVVIAAGREAEQEMRAEAARRADERQQHRQLHDTILSTLTMIAAGAFAGPSPALSAQAAGDLDVLRVLPEAPGPASGDAGDLCARLAEVLAQAAPLRARLTPAAVSLPPAVAGEVAACVAEALRNVARHAGTGQAHVRVRGGDGWVIVEIADEGRGFDPQSLPASRRGIRESIAGRMLAAGGTGVVSSQLGAGTTVVLRWPG
jgi:signal transduction histidine kinase